MSSRRDDVCEIIRALMDGPKTFVELCEVVDFQSAAVGDWIRSFRGAGVVRISARLPGKQYVYSLQASPFNLPDAPSRRDRSRRRMKAKEAA